MKMNSVLSIVNPQVESNGAADGYEADDDRPNIPTINFSVETGEFV